MGGSFYKSAAGLLHLASRFQVVEHRVQHAINELVTLLRAVSAGNFDGFVDRDFGWDVVKVDQLTNAHSQDHLVNNSESPKLPIRDFRLDERIQFIMCLNHFLDQFLRELKKLWFFGKPAEHVLIERLHRLLR